MDRSSDHDLRALHRRLEAIGARPVPDGEAELVRFMAHLPEQGTGVPGVSSPPTPVATTRGNVRRVRRILAIAAAIVLVGGSAFAAVGGRVADLFDGILGGPHVTVVPRPAPSSIGHGHRGFGGKPWEPGGSAGVAGGADQSSGSDDVATDQDQTGGQSSDDDQDQTQDQDGDDQGQDGDEQDQDQQGSGDEDADGDDQDSGGDDEGGDDDEGLGDEDQDAADSSEEART